MTDFGEIELELNFNRSSHSTHNLKHCTFSYCIFYILDLLMDAKNDYCMKHTHESCKLTPFLNEDV